MDGKPGKRETPRKSIHRDKDNIANKTGAYNFGKKSNGEGSVLVVQLISADEILLGCNIGSIIETAYGIKLELYERTDMEYLIETYEVFRYGSLDGISIGRENRYVLGSSYWSHMKDLSTKS